MNRPVNNRDVVPAPKLRHRGFRIYPLHSIPKDWSVDPDVLRLATLPNRAKENVVWHTRWGVRSGYIAIFAGSSPPQVCLRLAKLSAEGIERLDTATGAEDVIEAEEGKYFSESVHIIVNVKNGLAVGEYRPNSLSILGKWPGDLVSAALQKLGTVQSIAAAPVTFMPFPTGDFLSRALGKMITKFHLKMGPLNPQVLEASGVSSEVVEQLTLDGNVLGLDLGLSVGPSEPVNEGLATRLQRLATRLGDAGATKLEVTLEDSEKFDLLNDNFVKYVGGIDVAPGAGLGDIRAQTFDTLKQTLASHQAELLKMLP